MPPEIERLGVAVTHDVDEVIRTHDVLMFLRLQRERQEENFLPSIREYIRVFGVDSQRLKQAKEGVLIMHPGPVNRGVEVSAEVVDGKNSVILDQVTNGVAVRMAVLYLLGTMKKSETSS